MLELDRSPVALDPVLVDEASVPAEERRPGVPLNLVLVEGNPLVDDALHARHYRREVDLHVANADPELVGSAGVLCDLGGSDQSLRRDTPARNSGAAHEARLEERDPLPAAARGVYARPAAHP